MPASSVASFAGRMKGTSLPNSAAISAISRLSVVVTVRVIALEAKALFTDHPINGRPQALSKFLPGRPLDPPRAGISPKTRHSSFVWLASLPTLNSNARLNAKLPGTVFYLPKMR